MRYLIAGDVIQSEDEYLDESYLGGRWVRVCKAVVGLEILPFNGRSKFRRPTDNNE